MKKNAIISLAMLYALWQTKRSDLLDLIRPFVLYAVGVTTKVGDIIDVEGICRYMESEFGYQSFQCAVVERMKCFTFRAKRGNLQVTRDLASAVFLHYIYRLCNNLHGKNVATHQSIIVLSFSTYYLMFRMIGR